MACMYIRHTCMHAWRDIAWYGMTCMRGCIHACRHFACMQVCMVGMHMHVHVWCVYGVCVCLGLWISLYVYERDYVMLDISGAHDLRN